VLKVQGRLGHITKTRYNNDLSKKDKPHCT